MITRSVYIRQVLDKSFMDLATIGLSVTTHTPLEPVTVEVVDVGIVVADDFINREFPLDENDSCQ